MSRSPERHAIVTGAARGIGFAIAHRLAAQGLRVELADIDADGVERAASRIGERATWRRLDVRDAAACEALVADAERVDVLVNNAGIFEVKPSADLTPDDFRRMFEINLIGVFVLARAAAARMGDGGRIVNIASRAYLGAANYAHYVASKAAVVGLTRALALELAPRGILVNAVAPGAIDTPLLQAWSDDQRAKLADQQPVGALGRAEEVAELVGFLASDRMGFVTGQTILIDGGRSLTSPA